MTINVGDKISTANMKVMGKEGLEDVTTDDLFTGKKVAVFGLPGAFTKTCSAQHLPGFVASADALRAKGFDDVICMSVNDAFVMNAWGEKHEAPGKVTMIGDGNAEFTKAIGMDQDLSAKAMGVRSQRYSMVVENGEVKSIKIDAPGTYGDTSAETLLADA
jgi:glutaredoxin/glutathione-dependent peroxiredoxin